MTRFIARKLVHVTLVLLIVSFALAFLLDLTPGDPAYAILGEQATPEQVAQIHQQLNLDAPFYDRYWDWLKGIVQGDFGTSYRTQEKVLAGIWDRVPVTAELVVLTLLVSLIVSIPIGVYTAYRADGKIDRAWQIGSSMLISFPSFVSALLLVWVFAILLKDFPIHFPVTGWTKLKDDVGDNLWHIALPVVTLSFTEVAQYTRLLRADMVTTLQEDYILAARAKGLPTRRILFRHALRPSSLSLVTLAALSMGRLIGGAIIVEYLFALPGLGQYAIQNITSKDVVVVQGIVMFVAICYVLINTLTDVAYGYLDPRVRLRKA
jgi:peptide/nickel transport system permease protein